MISFVPGKLYRANENEKHGILVLGRAGSGRWRLPPSAVLMYVDLRMRMPGEKRHAFLHAGKIVYLVSWQKKYIVEAK